MEETCSRIKKVVLREDYMAITEDFREAIILNQFMYWSERVKDVDMLIEQENEIARRNGELERELLYGWIYKTADQMSEEVMGSISPRQVARCMASLVEKGFLDRRNNPKYKWDRTYQYRVNMINVALAMKNKGYEFSDFKITLPDDLESPIFPHLTNRQIKKTNDTFQNDLVVEAIPETTTDTTNKNYVKCKMVQPQKQDCTFNFQIFKNQIRRVCMEEYPDVNISAIQEILVYYCKVYRKYMGKDHPKQQNKHISKHIEFILSREFGLDVEYFKAIIDRYFEIDFGMDVDYNMNHFFTEGIFENREYELFL